MHINVDFSLWERSWLRLVQILKYFTRQAKASFTDLGILISLSLSLYLYQSSCLFFISLVLAACWLHCVTLIVPKILLKKQNTSQFLSTWTRRLLRFHVMKNALLRLQMASLPSITSRKCTSFCLLCAVLLMSLVLVAGFVFLVISYRSQLELGLCFSLLLIKHMGSTLSMELVVVCSAKYLLWCVFVY